MTDSPFLVVGLGNPGTEYSSTRHNLGFDVIDLLAQKASGSFQKKFHALCGQCVFDGRKVWLLKPQTFMNRSGLSVGEAVTFLKLDPATQVLVITDDLDLPPGNLRIRPSGGTGGHNGLKSIVESLGTEGFPRLRIGVGRSENQDGADYVLAKIPKSERKLYEEAIQLASEAVLAVVSQGVSKAMNTYNQKKAP